MASTWAVPGLLFGVIISMLTVFQEQLEAKLKHLEVSFPELVQLKLLGESVQGRKIYAVRITDHPEEKLELGEPSVKYVANMHGNEGWFSEELATKSLV